jgi:AraC-like DNA-binding protein
LKPALYLWRGCALVIGSSFDSLPHSHYAAQLSFGIDGAFRARLTDTAIAPDAPWHSTHAAIFGPNQPHALDCGGQRLAHLFIEVAHCNSTLCADFADAPGFAEVQNSIARVCRDGKSAMSLTQAADSVTAWRQCVPELGGAATRTNAHRGAQRVAQALAWMAAHPHEEPDGAQLAQLVHLSASRFTHLFRQQTGLSLSRYLLWTRILNTIDAIALGQNMTQAAHSAGFADSAHMSRSFRSIFGITPSELLKMAIEK